MPPEGEANSSRLMVGSYLWPGYHEDSSNHHILLIAILVTTKIREKLPAWSKHFARFNSYNV